MEDRNFGYIRIKLAEQIERQGISKNKLAQRAEMQYRDTEPEPSGSLSPPDSEVQTSP